MENERKNKMKRLELKVRGTERKVYIEKAIDHRSWRARTYVGSKIVSGVLYQNKLKVYRFIPLADGVNSHLI